LTLQKYTREFRYNIKLATPVIVGLIGHTMVQLIDNIMVGQLGTAELAAVSLGNSFVFIAMSLGIGFSTAITPLVAEADGTNDQERNKNIFVNSLILCATLGLFLSLAVWLAKPLLNSMGQPKEVVVFAFPYLFWVSLSLFPLVTFQAFKQFCDGLSFTRPSMYATLTGNAVNIVLNYFLIFGIGIFPKMGVEGAAIGTIASRIVMVFFIVLYMWRHPQFKEFIKSIKLQRFQSAIITRIMQLGFPSALQMFFEVGFFTAAIWLSGILGKNPQAANQIALNLSSITYMFAMGLGVVAMIRVGNQLGKRDFTELRRVALSLLLLILIFDIVFCAFFLLFNDQLPLIYLDMDNTSDLNNILEVIGLAASLLIVSGFFQISDGLQAVVLGALRGLQDVNIPAGIVFFAYIIFGLPISVLLGLQWEWGVVGVWIGLLSGLTASAGLLIWRFQYLTKKMIASKA